MTEPLGPADAIRYAAFAFGGLMLGMTISVLLSYMAKYKRLGKPKDRLLPLHVTVISISYLLLVGGTLAEIVDRLGAESLTWRTPTYLTAYVLGFVALMIVLRHVRYRTQVERLKQLERDVE